MNDVVISDKRKIKKRQKLSSYTDQPWKEVINLFFKDFMELCWPHIHDDIDWNHGHELIEQELPKIVKHGRKGDSIDKLIKVVRNNGVMTFVLLHFELQAEKEEFANRIKTYNNYLSLCHEHPVVSIGVLIDTDINWRPTVFESDLWGCRWRFEFPILKILDYRDRKQELERSKNIFSVVILTQLASLETQYHPTKRKDLKYNLAKALYLDEWPRDTISSLLKFMDGILRLPDPEELEYIKQIKMFEEELRVSYVTSFERFARQEGREEGRQEGRQEGREEGVHLGECRLFISQLEIKFGTIPARYLNQIQEASSEQVLIWAKRLLTAQSLSELFDN